MNMQRVKKYFKTKDEFTAFLEYTYKVMLDLNIARIKPEWLEKLGLPLIRNKLFDDVMAEFEAIEVEHRQDMKRSEGCYAGYSVDHTNFLRLVIKIYRSDESSRDRLYKREEMARLRAA